MRNIKNMYNNNNSIVNFQDYYEREMEERICFYCSIDIALTNQKSCFSRDVR